MLSASWIPIDATRTAVFVIGQYIGEPVGALAFADRAAAGEVRVDGTVTLARRVTTVGDRIEQTHPRPSASPTETSTNYDRQALLSECADRKS